MTDHTAAFQSIESLCKQGSYDRASQQALALLGPGIYRYLLRLSRQEADADDIYQLFCIDFLRGLPGFEWRASLNTWTYRLARNANLRFYRSPHQRPERNLSPEDHVRVSKLVQEVRESTAFFLKSAFKSGIQEVRAQLKPEDQELLILHVDRALPFLEIAAITLEEADDPKAIKREAARLRKRFERVKIKVAKLARKAGLV